MAMNGGIQYVIKSSTFSNFVARLPVWSQSVKTNAIAVTITAT
jgi:hypothetical protein